MILTSKVKTILGSILFLACFSGLALLCLKIDYRVTDTLYQPESIFGFILQCIGAWPTFFALIFGGATLFSLRYSGRFSLYTAFYALLCTAGYGALIIHTWKEAFDEMPNLIVAGPVILLLSLVTLYFFAGIPTYRLERYKKVAIACIGLGAGMLVSVTVLKYVWGRPRYRDIIVTGQEFVPWVQVNFLSGHKSFPSGHVGNASTMLGVTLFAEFTESKTAKTGLYILGIGWPLMVAFSRFIMGAHFPSDTLFAFGIAIILFSIIKVLVYKTRFADYF